MNDFTRRAVVKGGTALGAAAALSGPALLDWAKAWAQTAPWKPEKGAKLSLLRWKYFLKEEDDAFVKVCDAFTKATGVTVQTSHESYEDVQPKASVAANTGAGPDLFWGLYSLPHLFPQKCMDVTDVANYLDKKYGGWVPNAVEYCKANGKWIAIPVSYTGVYPAYRVEASRKAGFSKFPDTTAALLEYAKAMKSNGTPGGMALGHASGDANTWLYWCLWAHGGNLVDKNNKVIVNSPETAKALEYAKQLSQTFVSGTTSWNDASNNKAFLGGEIFWTNNAISLYVVAQRDAESRKKNLAEDIDHAFWPIGPIGKPMELQLLNPLLAMTYTKYPQACKALMAFILEAQQFNGWLESAQGYLTQTLNAYDANPVWTADPKRAVFAQAGKRGVTVAGLGQVDERAATAVSDFILVDMFANYCAGREDVKGAIAIADRQLKRIYR
jgi:multiple sugar transport system substrate-binding protein